MKIQFTTQFLAELNTPTQIYLCGWQESNDVLGVGNLDIEWKVRRSELRNSTLRSTWKDGILQFNLKNLVPGEEMTMDINSGYPQAIRVLFGFEEQVSLAFILFPEPGDLALTGNNIIQIPFPEARAEFVNDRKNTNNDFDFLEGHCGKNIKNILVCTPEENTTLVTKDSYFRSLRVKASEEGCKTGRCLDESGKYQDASYTFRTYSKISYSLFDLQKGGVKYNIKDDTSGFVQVLGEVTFDEYLVGKNGEITKIIENGSLEISGVDGVEIIEASSSSKGEWSIDNEWNRVYFETRIDTSKTSWGVFYLSISFMNELGEIQTIKSDSFKLVRGNYDSYIVVSPEDEKNKYSENGCPVFLFEAETKVPQRLKVEIRSFDVEPIDTTKIQIDLGELEEYFDITPDLTEDENGYKYVHKENGYFSAIYNIVPKTINSEFHPIPANSLGDLRLIPVTVNVLGDDIPYSFKSVEFYLIQKGKSIRFGAISEDHKKHDDFITTIDVEYSSESRRGFFIGNSRDLSLSSGIDGFWKIIDYPEEYIEFIPGEKGVFYSSEVDYIVSEDFSEHIGSYGSNSFIKFFVKSSNISTRDIKSLGKIKFIRVFDEHELETEYDPTSWKDALNFAEAEIEILQGTAPIEVNVPGEDIEVSKLCSIPLTIECNGDVYCRFIPNSITRINTKIGLSNYIQLKIANALLDPFKNLTIYIEGQDEILTPSTMYDGKYLYYKIENKTGLPDTKNLKLQIRFFDPRILVDAAEFGTLLFTPDPTGSDRPGRKDKTVKLKVKIDKSLDRRVTIQSCTFSNNVGPENKIWRNKHFFIPYGSATILLKSNYNIRYYFKSRAETDDKYFYPKFTLEISEEKEVILDDAGSIGATSTQILGAGKLIRALFDESGEYIGTELRFGSLNKGRDGYSERKAQIPHVFSFGSYCYYTENQDTLAQESIYLYQLPTPIGPDYILYSSYRQGTNSPYDKHNNCVGVGDHIKVRNDYVFENTISLDNSSVDRSKLVVDIDYVPNSGKLELGTGTNCWLVDYGTFFSRVVLGYSNIYVKTRLTSSHSITSPSLGSGFFEFPRNFKRIDVQGIQNYREGLFGNPNQNNGTSSDPRIRIYEGEVEFPLDSPSFNITKYNLTITGTPEERENVLDSNFYPQCYSDVISIGTAIKKSNSDFKGGVYCDSDNHSGVGYYDGALMFTVNSFKANFSNDPSLKTSLGNLELILRPNLLLQTDRKEDKYEFSIEGSERHLAIRKVEGLNYKNLYFRNPLYSEDAINWDQSNRNQILSGGVSLALGTLGNYREVYDTSPNTSSIHDLQTVELLSSSADYNDESTKKEALQLAIFLRDLLTTKIQFNLNYIKDIIRVSGDLTVMFNGGNCKPVVEYSENMLVSQLKVLTEASDPYNIPVGCTASVIPLEGTILRKRFDDLININCKDRSKVLELSKERQEAFKLSEDITWTADFKIPVFRSKDGDYVLEELETDTGLSRYPVKCFRVEGIQKGHSTGILHSGKLYVGTGNKSVDLGSIKSHICKFVIEDFSVVLLSSLKNEGNPTTAANFKRGISVISIGSTNYLSEYRVDSTAKTLTLDLIPKGISAGEEVISFRVLFESTDGVKDSIDFNLRRLAASISIDWVDSAKNNGKYTFLSDGTSAITLKDISKKTFRIDSLVELHKDTLGQLKVGDNELIVSETEDLLEENSDKRVHHYTAFIEAPINEGSKDKSGVITLSYTNEGVVGNATINYLQGHLKLSSRAKNSSTVNSFKDPYILNLNSQFQVFPEIFLNMNEPIKSTNNIAVDLRTGDPVVNYGEIIFLDEDGGEKNVDRNPFSGAHLSLDLTESSVKHRLTLNLSEFKNTVRNVYRFKIPVEIVYTGLGLKELGSKYGYGYSRYEDSTEYRYCVELYFEYVNN